MWAGVFPGQGSQSVGMGKFLFENFPLAKELFEEASDTLKQDMKKLCFEGPEADLQLTENTQPALLLVSTVAYRCLHGETGFSLAATAGHSIGEYAAVVAAGSMNFADALRSVKKRGQFMQSAVPVGEGGMVAVMGISPEQVAQLCKWAMEKSGQGPLEPANYNAPGQIVISGSQKAITWLKDNFKKDIFDPEPKKLRLIPLKVSAPFHCSMMSPAAENMAEVLGQIDFNEAQVAVVQNVTAEPTTDGSELRDNLIKQIAAPVRWVECVEKLKSLGAEKLVEFGAGQVLAGLIKKIDSEKLTTFNMNSLEEFKALVKEF